MPRKACGLRSRRVPPSWRVGAPGPVNAPGQRSRAALRARAVCGPVNTPGLEGKKDTVWSRNRSLGRGLLPHRGELVTRKGIRPAIRRGGLRNLYFRTCKVPFYLPLPAIDPAQRPERGACASASAARIAAWCSRPGQRTRRQRGKTARFGWRPRGADSCPIAVGWCPSTAVRTRAGRPAARARQGHCGRNRERPGGCANGRGDVDATAS
jgi:hypothetical protein